jgi:type III restriction enzyme
MALDKDFPQSPHAILDPGIRWFPADESLRENNMEKLMPSLVPALCHTVKEFQDGGTWAQRTRARACSISGSTGRT